MDDFWGVTIVLFIVLTVLVALIVRITEYWRRYHTKRHEKVLFSECGAKSGDIVLSVSHTHGFINSVFSFDLYSHAAMVVEIGGELYVSEAALDIVPDPETGEDTALPPRAQLNLLSHRLHHYNGMLFLMQLARPLTAGQKEVLLARAHEQAPYPGPYDLLAAFLSFGDGKKTRHCMQHTAWLLDEMGLTPTDLLERGRTFLNTGFFAMSRAVTTLPGRPLGTNGQNKYEPVRELLFDAKCRAF